MSIVCMQIQGHHANTYELKISMVLKGLTFPSPLYLHIYLKLCYFIHEYATFGEIYEKPERQWKHCSTGIKKGGKVFKRQSLFEKSISPKRRNILGFLGSSHLLQHSPTSPYLDHFVSPCVSFGPSHLLYKPHLQGF